MTTNFTALISALSIAEKVELLSGSGLWRTATIARLGIPGLVMTDGTYGVRYSRAQIDGDEKWSMDDFLNVVGQHAGEVTGEEATPGGSEALFSPSLPATCFPNCCSLPAG